MQSNELDRLLKDENVVIPSIDFVEMVMRKVRRESLGLLSARFTWGVAIAELNVVILTSIGAIAGLAVVGTGVGGRPGLLEGGLKNWAAHLCLTISGLTAVDDVALTILATIIPGALYEWMMRTPSVPVR